MSARAPRLALSLLLVAALARAAAAQPDEPKARGFDHIDHDGKLAVAGAEPLPCARCHPTDAGGKLTGALGHKTCFGACHGAAPPARAKGRPYAIAERQRPLCINCHAPNDIDKAVRGAPVVLKPFYPPFRLESDYGLDFGHARHAAPARAAQGCLTCHAVPPEPGKPRPKRPAVHARCAGCHAAPANPAIAPMTACTTCHKEAFGPATAPHRQPGKFPVADTFSHARHLGRAGGGAASCDRCHQNAADTDSESVPSPTTASCAAAGCHDGTAAFSTLTPSCRRCHGAPQRAAVGASPERVPYSHALHEQRGAPATCATCHAGGGDAPASRDHRPCSDAGCHRDEFASAKPTICGACHVGTEPWRALHRDQRLPAETEFGAVFSHRRHLAGERPPVTAPCDSCHNSRSAERDMRPPHDHASCTSSGCHASGGASPTANDCAGCHRRELITDRRADRLAKRWSVRARFRHAPHRTDAGQPVACTTCHTAMLDSDMLSDVPPPPKSACVSCHDGGKAFKVTGHACARCHGRWLSPPEGGGLGNGR